MRVWGMRINEYVAATCSLMLIAGCAPRLQGFNKFESPHVYNISTSDVANQVRCELNEFITVFNESEGQRERHFRPSHTPADVNLLLQTDVGGYVQYIGIDLNKAGLSTLGELVAANGKSPSLGARISPKSVVSATVTMTVSQDAASPNIKTNCEKYLQGPKSQFRKLWLKQWLNNFFDDSNQIFVEEKIDDLAGIPKAARVQGARTIKDVELQTVKLSTAFTLAVDISAGLNPLFGTSYLIPISGMNADFNPQLVHKLDMTFYLCRGSNVDVTGECARKEKDKTTTQDKSTVRLSDIATAVADELDKRKKAK